MPVGVAGGAAAGRALGWTWRWISNGAARPAGRAAPFEIHRHVPPKARPAAAPPATPTGIDYLRLVEDRHTSALGQRLHYAHLTDPAHLTDSAQPAEPALPPPDDDGLAYQADLLTLADEPDLPTTPGPDPALAAELAAPTGAETTKPEELSLIHISEPTRLRR